MKILLATHNFYPYNWGGTEVYVIEEARFLLNRGYSPIIIAAVPNEAFEENPAIFQDENLKICQYEYESILVLGVQYTCTTTEQLYSKSSLRCEKSWDDFLLSNDCFDDIDILHIHGFTAAIGLDLFNSIKNKNNQLKIITSYHTPISCPKGTLMFANTLKECQIKADAAACASCRLSEVLNIPFKITEYIDTLISVFNFQQGPALLRNRKLAALDIDAFKQLDSLTDEWWVYSEGIKENLLRNGVIHNKIKVSRHGISEVFLSAKKIKKESKEIVFLYSGRLAKIKGFHTLIKAWLGLPVISERKLLITASPYSDDKSIQKLIVKAVKRKDIHFIGSMDQAELASAYREANFVIIPSECYEIGPMVFHEAAALGCSIIASDIGGNLELSRIYKNQSIVFESGNIYALMTAIMSFENDHNNFFEKEIIFHEKHFASLYDPFLNGFN